MKWCLGRASADLVHLIITLQWLLVFLRGQDLTAGFALGKKFGGAA